MTDGFKQCPLARLQSSGLMDSATEHMEGVVPFSLIFIIQYAHTDWPSVVSRCINCPLSNDCLIRYFNLLTKTKFIPSSLSLLF